jgi:competence CoiA-like predicted nuclease
LFSVFTFTISSSWTTSYNIYILELFWNLSGQIWISKSEAKWALVIFLLLHQAYTPRLNFSFLQYLAWSSRRKLKAQIREREGVEPVQLGCRGSRDRGASPP